MRTIRYTVTLPLSDQDGNPHRPEVLEYAEKRVLTLDGVTDYTAQDSDAGRVLEFEAEPSFGLDYGFHQLGHYYRGYFHEDSIPMRTGGRSFRVFATSTFNID